MKNKMPMPDCYRRRTNRLQSPHWAPHDEYEESSDIDTSRFTFSTTVLPGGVPIDQGVRVTVKYDEENGDTLVFEDGSEISDPDAIEEYLGSDFDRYLNDCTREQDRLHYLQRDMEQLELEQAQRDTADHYRSMQEGRG